MHYLDNTVVDNIEAQCNNEDSNYCHNRLFLDLVHCLKLFQHFKKNTFRKQSRLPKRGVLKCLKNFRRWTRYKIGDCASELYTMVKALQCWTVVTILYSLFRAS